MVERPEEASQMFTKENRARAATTRQARPVIKTDRLLSSERTDASRSEILGTASR